MRPGFSITTKSFETSSAGNMPFLTFLANVFRSGTPESFGRLSALPFL